MTVRALLLLPLLFAACSTEGRLYDNNDLVLATTYTAKEACSCVFVMHQSEDHCRAWTKANPNVATFTVDRASKSVRSSALFFWGARARLVNERQGCVVD